MNDDEILQEIYRRSEEKKRKIAKRRRILGGIVPVVAVVCVLGLVISQGRSPSEGFATVGTDQRLASPGDSSVHSSVHSSAGTSADTSRVPAATEAPSTVPEQIYGSNSDNLEGSAGYKPEGGYRARFIRQTYHSGGNDIMAGSQPGIRVQILTSREDAVRRLPEEVAADYSEDFFQNKELLIFTLTEASGSVRHTLTGVEIKGTTIYLDVTRQVPEIGTADMASWLAVVEVEKTEAIASCTDARVRLH